MRVAVISDIHANLHALEAVAEAIDRERVDAVWCLGDVVGYGPEPNGCCDWTAIHAVLCLAGNHDLGVLGRLDLEDFSTDAGTAAVWTRGVLHEQARTFLQGLSSSAGADGVELFHASPRDPVWEYVLGPDAALAAFEATAASIVLVGHSHIPLAIGLSAGKLGGGHAQAGFDADLRHGRWLVNPGSVGQPRDGDPKAAWLLLDLDARAASFRRVEYDIARTQAEIRDRGLPDALADRLGLGV